AVLDEKGSIDATLIEEEVVGVVRQTKEERPDLGAVLLECSMLPPYARAVQEAVDLPVFDFVTMIDFLYSGTHRKRYDGFY
ncbi:MAG: aspartate/glutamate racemase family protein, partial [Acidobacteriota bacterium]